MNIEPLPRTIYDKAKNLGVDTITLKFSGGHDEGILNVETDPTNEPDFIKEITDWAWSVYSYSGAGDGVDYGDNIAYNLRTNEVCHIEWYYEYNENLRGGELIVE